ncbi:MAG: GtrA family protein [Anaerocolumna jejuensis]
MAVSQVSLRYPKRINRMKQIDMRSMADKLINRETIVYVIAGGMTTAVNMATYYVLCYWAMMNHLIANIIAWVIAVTFAYFVNAGWVFRDKRTAVKEELYKMMKFFLARIFSLGVEEGGLFLFVSLLMWNNMAVKAGLAVIVIIINYVFSKFYIFNSTKKTTES